MLFRKALRKINRNEQVLGRETTALTRTIKIYPTDCKFLGISQWKRLIEAPKCKWIRNIKMCPE
jgi:hypothetical protein